MFMEMEKEEQIRVVEEQEQEQEDDDADESTTSSLLLRKSTSRDVSDGNYNTITSSDEPTNNNNATVGASNGRISVNNGHAVILMTAAPAPASASASAAAAKNDEDSSSLSSSSSSRLGRIIDDEKTKEEDQLVHQNGGSEEESKNGEKKSENLLVFYQRDQEEQVQEDPAPDELASSNGNNSTEKEYGRHLENGSSSNVFIIHQNNFSSTENKYEIHLENGQVYPNELSQHTVTNAKYEVHTGETLNFVDNISSVTGVSVTQGKDTVITIDTQHAESSQNLQGITTPTASATALVSSGTQIVIRSSETSEERKGIEVIKSIVYGGLAESITSLSVVSSAAGGSAATLNILALGTVNLIGGLFIICHNLWELRSDRVEQVSNQITDEVSNKRDRYKELLGRSENFIPHAVVAIVSYFIFGLIPPLVYGLSFRMSDDKELKLLGVPAASFVCVVILALGKAYVQRSPKPYIKAVSTYVILGFMVSGVSYAAGLLVERLLQELALFHPTSSSSSSSSSTSLSNLLVPQAESAAAAAAAAAWSSY